MAVRPEEITSILREQIEKFGAESVSTNVGTVVEAGDGIARVTGLSNVMASELVEFPSGVMGLTLNLEEANVGVMILGDYTDIKEGDEVRATGRVAQVPVGDLVRFLEGQPDDPVKILLIGPDERLDAVAAAYRAGGFGAEDLPHLVRSEATYLEIQPRGVTKGAGLVRVCKLLGIPPSAAIAFGDNLNDLEMIQAAGLGVAMGNAHADLKRAARMVAPSNDEDGVAAVLWTHVLSA